MKGTPGLALIWNKLRAAWESTRLAGHPAPKSAGTLPRLIHPTSVEDEWNSCCEWHPFGALCQGSTVPLASLSPAGLPRPVPGSCPSPWDPNSRVERVPLHAPVGGNFHPSSGSRIKAVSSSESVGCPMEAKDEECSAESDVEQPASAECSSISSVIVTMEFKSPSHAHLPGILTLG